MPDCLLLTGNLKLRAGDKPSCVLGTKIHVLLDLKLCAGDKNPWTTEKNQIVQVIWFGFSCTLGNTIAYEANKISIMQSA